jgi:hypothetical protein
MTHNQETQSLQKAYQGTTTWNEAMEACRKIGNNFPLPNPRAKCERSDAFRYFLLSTPVGFVYNELYSGNLKIFSNALMTSSSAMLNWGPCTLKNVSCDVGN